jgi:Family of unknown function (DUF6491)
MRYPVPRILTAATLLALGACAVGARHETDQQVADRYNAYAGEPIDHFSWLGHYDGWEPVGRHELVLKTGVSDAYLIKVGPPCDSLPFANRIGFTSTTGAVYTRLDAIITNGWRCPIEEIRKVDYQRMRADMRLEAQKAKAATQSQ